MRAAEVRPRREPGVRTHAYRRERERERGQACFLLAACYKYYLSGQIFCFENSQIPRTASTHQSKRRGEKCQCFLHPKTSSKQTRSRLLHSQQRWVTSISSSFVPYWSKTKARFLMYGGAIPRTMHRGTVPHVSCDLKCRYSRSRIDQTDLRRERAIQLML